MGATPPAAPQSSVRRLACGTVCTVVEYGSVKEIELYHFQPFVRRGRTRPRMSGAYDNRATIVAPSSRVLEALASGASDEPSLVVYS